MTGGADKNPVTIARMVRAFVYSDASLKDLHNRFGWPVYYIKKELIAAGVDVQTALANRGVHKKVAQ